jgi:hypothetical protein
MVPAITDEKAFYHFCQTYTAGINLPRNRTFPGECRVCGGSGHVLTRRRELVTCPRWQSDTKKCWTRSVEPFE